MPRKKNRRKEFQAKRRAEEATKAPKPKQRVAVVDHGHMSGATLALLASSVLRRSNQSN